MDSIPQSTATISPRRILRVRPAAWWVAYVFFLRVHLVTAAVLFVGPFYGRTSTLLGGLFDIDGATPGRTVLGMALITLAALATALTLLATAWTTIVNAPARFNVPRVPWAAFPITWPERELFTLLAVPTIAVTIYQSATKSNTSLLLLFVGALVGVAAAIGGVRWTNAIAAWLGRDIAEPHPRSWIGRRIQRLVRWLSLKSGVRDGFVDPDTAALKPGHLLSAVAWFQSVLLYTVIGIRKYVRLGSTTYVSTLACALLLILMLCWMATAAAFFFDRYRVPVLLALLFLPALTAWVPWSDHFYLTYTGPSGYSAAPGALLNIDANKPAIVIAANGGGIQAGAWAARVLVGLDRALRPEFGDGYARSIRLVSSVSGGGVGAMHFIDKYENGTIAPDRLNDVVAVADTSSLDDVAWGAAYPDLWRAFVPLPFRSTQIDRGQALEWSWAAHDPQVTTRLAQWRLDASAGRRPAMIFNATLVDTGERLLIGSARVGWSEFAGLRNFEDQYENTDVQVVTAARLSGSFTYVSPATRSNRPGPDFHVVDGGYYDNYGMATALGWIHQSLEDSGAVRHLLLIQVRGAPSVPRSEPDRWHGWFYQVGAPVEAVLQVRTTGQRSHNDEELDRLTALWCEQGVRIETATFEYRRDDAPLSWHLTGEDKRNLDAEWQRQSGGQGVEAVRSFLRTERLKVTDPVAYARALACPAHN